MTLNKSVVGCCELLIVKCHFAKKGKGTNLFYLELKCGWVLVILREKNAPRINQKLKVILQQYSVFSCAREGTEKVFKVKLKEDQCC